MELTAAIPMNVYRVETTDGRIFAWSATDLEHLFRSLTERGHRAKHVELLDDERGQTA
jgi:hypothetical protein